MKKLSYLMSSLILISMFLSCKHRTGDEGVLAKMDDKRRQHLIDSFKMVDSIRKGKEETFKKAPKTTIKFKEDNHDFGNIFEGDIVTHNFIFYNTGENPLIINNAMGSCGCTVPSYPDEPVMPGDSGVMKVEFNSLGKHGATTKSVTIIANTEPQISEITITSNIKDKPGKKKNSDEE